ncbi:MULTISPECIES: ribosomal protein uL16 3-hydroxylase [Enterobacteriaceae]|uniref:50S ribosomal protein L16 arginine hydroxylase n=1 Tax=Kluyvera genomosp. 2 TaxID=2774054 RepID=A0A2T2Y0K2_9ENTR|nr:MULTISPECIES: cupin domain-containing protein [Enterobacteriaceae]HAT3919276.1 cupin domain-containing protein [Kluyvera ascorbata]PSR46042.1 50S ribosomal protein L16 arginine hydroxylase [Kluyvera genomosp. 2]BBQ85103.1 50S ribosomal protein L16 arginine hydroxylase [Klebsiella sp. WP3-W18-ESBL-02]BBR22155.1 50S ribosomal protein L16 arginine hydroxylase [Klebsiella sp. WP3-S18-ESBL-05]BBR57686.1 50S ribosomal protein L16 arginine hydroxylase [Klebsiella sp. WP4-W18-ESBL-05]
MAYQLNLNWPEFLEKYWQKQPVVLKNAFPNFVDPITPDELAGLAMEMEVDSRLVSHIDGKWQASNGPFEDFDHLGEKNWSLLAQAVNHWHEPSAELVRPFRALPDWRLDDLMISFSVPGGGVGPHIDPYDVFIIQGMGRRRWRVGDALPLKQHCPHPALLHVEPFTPIIDVEMAPGDILYIPPGFPHDGYTYEDTLNYSVGFRGPNGRELISSFADYVLENDLGEKYYTDPDLTCREHVGKVEDHELERLRTMMIDMIRQPNDFKQWFGSFVTTPRHELDIAPAEPAYTPEEVATALEAGETLRRLNGLRVLNVGDSVFINSEKLETCAPQAADALCRYTELDKSHFGEALANPAFIAELTDLINQGYWFFDE